MSLAVTLPLCLGALLLEALVGYPDLLYRAIGHPVTWMGALLTALDHRFNRPGLSFIMRRLLGLVTLGLLLAAVALVTFIIERLSAQAVLGFAVLVVIAASLPAQRSLDRHVAAVAEALEGAGLEAGRTAVGRIVGRNVAGLDEAGVARAAVESLAENFSDGIVAPAFWLALGGLTGGALYKAANTADSMIGHRNPRYLAFGWAAARFDDLINLPASRLAALLLMLAAPMAGGSMRGAARTVWRDAGRHRSPNAGWPEAAMAGAFDLQLAGPRVYGDTLVEDAFMGAGRREVGAPDIRRALRLYRLACALQVVVLMGAVLVLRG